MEMQKPLFGKERPSGATDSRGPDEARTWRATRPHKDLAPELDFDPESRRPKVDGAALLSQSARSPLAARDPTLGLPLAAARDLTLGLRKLQPHQALEGLPATGSKGLALSVYERESPRAQASLRAFLCEFLVEDARGAVRVRQDIDLRRYAAEARRPVTNATVQELCVMQPAMTSLDASRCGGVGDAALLALARHCPDLHTARLGGTTLSRVGLRALCAGCPRLRVLALPNCAGCDDAALAAVGAGCPALTALDVSRCGAVSDDGLAIVAQGCRSLTRLDVSGCLRIGEFGDRALLALARHCAKLQSLDMFGCRNVMDAGIVAVSRGCSGLEQFRLTGCARVTGRATDALARRCPQITDLSLADCAKIRDADLCRMVGVAPQRAADDDDASDAWSASTSAPGGPSPDWGPLLGLPFGDGLTRLTCLDVSGCGVRAAGLGAMSRRCPGLLRLTLARCPAVDDAACEALRGAVGLRALDLSGCPRVSERGVGSVARGVTALAKLDLTGCRAVSRRFLLELLAQALPYSDAARDFVGFEAKPDADARRAADGVSRRRGSAATALEALWRGALARVGIGAHRRRKAVERGVVAFQAAVRARRERAWVAAALLRRRRNYAAVRFQATLRGLAVRREARRNGRLSKLRAGHAAAAAAAQRAYRAHRARLRVWALRRAVYLARLDAARAQARRERRAAQIQALWRGGAARGACDAMRRKDANVRRARQRKKTAAVQVQRLWRGRASVATARGMQADVVREKRRWATVRTMQRLHRGLLARRRAKALRADLEHRAYEAAATVIKAWWRGSRARFFATFAAAMRAIRAQEAGAAIGIEKHVRGLLALLRCKRIVVRREDAQKRELAAMVVQRLVRGHNGRTKWEVAHRLEGLRSRAEPLYARLDFLNQEAEAAAKHRDAAAAALAAAHKDAGDVAAELREVARVGRPFWDTARLSGHAQRYQTAFLKKRLTEMLAEKKAAAAELGDRVHETAAAARDKNRLVRQVKRELTPLADGLAERAKHERTARLRTAVRDRARGATAIQRVARGGRLRTAWAALRDGGHEQWLVLPDPASGELFYYNDLTQETRWARPLELDIHLAGASPRIFFDSASLLTAASPAASVLG
ncbi:hypothetical protein M885DRAFT_472235 [Pelagophyceae sp. CCMP2097]|nr:hypothetical protein M885DRAFT_472235 [Pelagophyceae sp. CCMP2097]